MRSCCPAAFRYGDYIRTGAVARFSPVMAEVVRFAEKGGPVLGICNGFQILCEAHLLPGALLRNRGLKFICKPVDLRVDGACDWLDLPLGTVLQVPINHNEGNFTCDAETLDRLNANGQVVLRYCEPDGSSSREGSAPNGALDDIAGICNERRQRLRSHAAPRACRRPGWGRYRRAAVLHDGGPQACRGGRLVHDNVLLGGPVWLFAQALILGTIVLERVRARRFADAATTAQGG